MNYDFIQDLLALPKVVETHNHMHHNVRKYDHLMRSACYCYRLAPLLGADRRVAVRAAVLHDIDSRLGTLRTHGLLAASYAASIGEPNEVCQAIVSHMYPLGPAPTSREGWVLALADKIATVTDITNFIRGLFTGTSMPLRRQLQRSDPFYRIHDERKGQRQAARKHRRSASLHRVVKHHFKNFGKLRVLYNHPDKPRDIGTHWTSVSLLLPEPVLQNYRNISNLMLLLSKQLERKVSHIGKQ